MNKKELLEAIKELYEVQYESKAQDEQALKLIKKLDEPKECNLLYANDEYSNGEVFCGICLHEIKYYFNYCDNCGAKIKKGDK
jgi:hypothetical protein